MSEPPVRVTSLGRGVFRLQHPDGHHQLAYAATDGARTWVFVDGLTYVVEPARTGRSAAAHDVAALSAPMPATVAHVHVTPGQQVARGDVLITLEAMKMELPIRAISDGTVTRINCRAGELVQPGVPLLELRDDVPGDVERRTEFEPEHEPGAGKGEP